MIPPWSGCLATSTRQQIASRDRSRKASGRWSGCRLRIGWRRSPRWLLALSSRGQSFARLNLFCSMLLFAQLKRTMRDAALDAANAVRKALAGAPPLRAIDEDEEAAVL